MMFSLRKAAAQDSDFLFTLRNDPLTREMSKSQAEVSRAEHEAWLQAQLAQDTCMWIVVCDGIRAGQIRISSCLISVSIAPDFRGRGLLSMVLSAAAGEARGRGICDQLVAHVKKTNEASLKGFRKAGFVFSKNFEEHGTPYEELTLGL
jgi:L-amino acid N-acyltransferase YncA